MIRSKGTRLSRVLFTQIPQITPEVAAAGVTTQRILAAGSDTPQNCGFEYSRYTGGIPPCFQGAHVAGFRSFSASAEGDDSSEATSSGSNFGNDASVPEVTGNSLFRRNCDAEWTASVVSPSAEHRIQPDLSGSGSIDVQLRPYMFCTLIQVIS